MARKKRTKYTEAQRRQILETAVRDKLTAKQVKQKYGVTPVTYYSWRKKYGAGKRRGRRPAKMAGAGGGALTQQVRSEVQSKVRGLVQAMVRAEVNSYLDSLFGRRGPGRPRRR
jgi:transposase-like protein